MEEEYYKILASGMFFEFYPELSGDYSKDKWEWKIIYHNLLNIRKKMNAPGFEKEYAFEKLRHLEVEPNANLKPLPNSTIERKIEPKPILFVQVPIIAHEDFNEIADQLEQKIADAGWFLLWSESHVEKTEYKIQSFTLKDSQEVQVQELKEIILNAIKGK